MHKTSGDLVKCRFCFVALEWAHLTSILEGNAKSAGPWTVLGSLQNSKGLHKRLNESASPLCSLLPYRHGRTNPKDGPDYHRTGLGGEFLGTIQGGWSVCRGVRVRRVGQHKGNEVIHAEL